MAIIKTIGFDTLQQGGPDSFYDAEDTLLGVCDSICLSDSGPINELITPVKKNTGQPKQGT
ncbi:hypothetical protein [Prochlorococcus marinus]|uniref:hypothetical protein n=1 Tax=Prochlorococcus marinus TaxID=1219 RepID=UPI0022B3A056|nr:hypothetical protein [Prochlorococcus marinus]